MEMCDSTGFGETSEASEIAKNPEINGNLQTLERLHEFWEYF